MDDARAVGDVERRAELASDVDRVLRREASFAADPRRERLALEMARLQRVAHRVVWVNPLKAAPGYAPLARGMAAALPYVDNFVEGHSLVALERLAAVIGGRTRIGQRRSRS